ncbi:WbuC family cupin fold metalloprotein [Flavobacteriaceae bacterium]|nr:WbuC family cupin fold metalloprotein [Flavobacteriaceae bacterium]
MIKYFSKIEPDKLLHVIVKKSDIKSGRIDVIPEENYIQCALLNLKKNTTFKPHKHIWKKRSSSVIAQESWIVINGSVKCIFYDLDDKILATPILREGDASFTLQGGHTYEILEDNTLVYEMKTGPYEGQEMDKVFI